ncbi:MAG: zincin-like metallopeptidase domain-containing protein, partial [Chloroflexi bacterium]|nr:zincin-like metallopeptidase domain-containing protein [Chloroflexota bacterium]
TLFHELAHSTGHPRRLAREGYRTAARFGSERYSQEELVAEFAAAFLGSEAGIDPSRVEQSAAYIASWLRVLDDDRRLVVVAAAQGQRASDHILGRTPERDAEPGPGTE